MALYTQDSIERVREAVDIVELVSAKTELRRVGSRWVGQCPFHEDRTPSFSVDPEKKVYYCFGCEEGGDAIGYLRETEALEFREAIETLAERYNVELVREAEDPQAEERRRRRDRLLSLTERAAKFYASFLWDSEEGAAARSYLAERGLSDEVLREFRVGFSPGAWDRVSAAARRDGFSERELEAAGLAIRGKQGKLYDRFRGRIMFPLADARGRVLGFGARRLGEGDGPKYLNSAEGPLYKKGQQLFGIDLARPAAAKAARTIVVEGYTDVLALHQAGLTESVAIMGTAFTSEQLGELKRAAPLVVLALDADASGMNAMQRAIRGAASDGGVELRVAEMPQGSDPADLLSGGGVAEFNGLLERAVSVLRFQLRRVLADTDLETPVSRDQAMAEAQALIAAGTLARTAERDALVRLVADGLDVPPDYVIAGLGGGSAPASVQQPRRDAPEASAAGSASLASDRAFLAACLASGEAGRDYLNRLEDAQLSSDTARGAKRQLAGHFEDPLAGLEPDGSPVGAFVAAIAVDAQELAPASASALQADLLRLELRRLEREEKVAAHEGDRSRQNALARAKQDVLQEMNAVMGQTA